jgi:hypothetical protein
LKEISGTNTVATRLKTGRGYSSFSYLATKTQELPESICKFLQWTQLKTENITTNMKTAQTAKTDNVLSAINAAPVVETIENRGAKQIHPMHFLANSAG